MSNTQIALDATGTKLNFDNNTFVIDENNNRVGIGTNSPSAKLEVQGGLFNCNNAGTKSLEYNPYAQTITSAGATLNFLGTDFRFLTNVLVAQQSTQRVGIGTTQPGEKLEVNGGSDATRIKVKTTTGNAVFRLHTNTSDFSIVGRGDTNLFNIFDANADKTPFIIDGSGSPENYSIVIKNGNVGIRTNDPSELLHLKGTGDVKIKLEADINDTAEDNNPEILLSQDGGGVNASIGMDLNNNLVLKNQWDHVDADLVLGAKNTEYVRIKGTGNVGIGEDSPQELLHISGTSDPTLVIQNPTGNETESGKISFREGTFDTEQINLRYDGSQNSFKIDTKEISNAFVVRRITGNVGIGTSEPASKLEVEGIISSYGASALIIQDDSGTTITSKNNTEGSITVTHNFHLITHGATDNDTNVNLININGGANGSILVLKQLTNTKDVKLIDGDGSGTGGNLRLNGDFQMNTGNDTITLIKSGTIWFELSRSNNAD